MGLNLFSSILIVLLLKLFTNGLPIQELYEGSNCVLEDGKPGVCRKIPDCPSRLKEVMEGRRSSDSMGRCGFENFIEIVCCESNITNKLDLRPAEIACRQYENEITQGKDVKQLRDEVEVQFNIFAGLQAGPGEFPYMVALGYENQEDDNNTQPIAYNCGGTLISSQHVLTAAHCVNNVQEKVPIEVRLGSTDLNEADAKRIPISDVITHPRYKRSQNYHDVAILKLRTPVGEASNNIRPICMQTKSLATTDVPPTAAFIVIGWGATSFDDVSSTKLMKTPSLSFVDRDSCGKSFTGFNKLPRGLDENMLCVLDTNITRRSDACQGDSGGPLLMLAGPNQSIVGITSFGQTCGGPVPGIYTAVYSYLDWIERQVWPETVNDKR